jgi:YHS domain-containing protein
MNTTTTVTDPVCGMAIDPAEAVGSTTYNGETYHFCARACETKFNVAAESYVVRSAAPEERGACCSTAHACC